MTTPFAMIGGERVRRARVHVPGVGVWYAEIELEGDRALSGRQTLTLGGLRLVGTIDDSRSGTNALVAHCVLVAGGGGWSRVLGPRPYHSDSGVRASTVAQDAAREAGEQLGNVRAASEMLGVDYVRSRGSASTTLADVAAGVPWWVDLEGVTHIAARDEAEAARDTYEVIEVDPAERLASLLVDDLTRVGIGSVLTERLDEPLTIRAMEIDVDDTTWTVRAWCGAPSTSSSRLASTLRGFVQRVTADRLLGVWAYQVVRQNADGRLELRPVESGAGLPDVGPVSVWTGVAGASSEVTAGAEVLVEFINGDRRRPLVRGFAANVTPTSTTLDASGASASLKAGAGATKTLAYAEDVAVELGKIAATLATGANGGGDVIFATEYTPPVAAAIGTSKLVAS